MWRVTCPNPTRSGYCQGTLMLIEDSRPFNHIIPCRKCSATVRVKMDGDESLFIEIFKEKFFAPNYPFIAKGCYGSPNN